MQFWHKTWETRVSNAAHEKKPPPPRALLKFHSDRGGGGLPPRPPPRSKKTSEPNTLPNALGAFVDLATLWVLGCYPQSCGFAGNPQTTE